MPSDHRSIDHSARSRSQSLRPLRQRAVVGLVLNADAIAHQLALSFHLLVLTAIPLREAPLARQHNLRTLQRFPLRLHIAMNSRIDGQGT